MLVRLSGLSVVDGLRIGSLYVLYWYVSLFLALFRWSCLATITQLGCFILVGIAGAATIGSQILLYAYVAQYYPTNIRSTGLGWASGVGRNGAIFGPMVGGTLLAMALPHQVNFLVLAVPGIIATISMILVDRNFSSKPLSVEA